MLQILLGQYVNKNSPAYKVAINYGIKTITTGQIGKRGVLWRGAAQGK